MCQALDSCMIKWVLLLHLEESGSPEDTGPSLSSTERQGHCLLQSLPPGHRSSAFFSPGGPPEVPLQELAAPRMLTGATLWASSARTSARSGGDGLDTVVESE